MIARRQFVVWLLLALVAVSVLITVLFWERQRTRERYSTFLAGDPHLGMHVFQEKGCAYCHAVNGTGGRLGPDLGATKQAKANLNQLVTAMWNHAPAMWKRMQAEKLVYPGFDEEEMAHLFAYLYEIRYVDEPGDISHGRQLFETKGCVQCHSIRGEGGHGGPDLAQAGVDTPIAWTQTMWNHAPEMEAHMREQKLEWPRFQGREMNDLLAFVREVCSGPRREYELLPADADRGAEVFQKKGCAACHSVKGEGGKGAPNLGPSGKLPPTIVQFAGAMWSHSPEMWQAMKKQKIERPTFEGKEMADLIAFLYRLRYFEPTGQALLGKTLFTERGCSRCHGERAEGTSQGPRLRRRAQVFTPVTLATALWQHGPKMYHHTQEMGLRWPTIEEKDVSDLVAFLNAPPEEPR